MWLTLTQVQILYLLGKILVMYSGGCVKLMKQSIVISHCRRRDYGGEDVALEKISEEKESVSLNLHGYDKNVILCLLKFFFSLRYFFFVLKNRDKRHIVCNPFPSISLLSIILLGMAHIPLRLYVHNFSLSCIGGANFRDGKLCETHKKQKYCLNFRCCSSGVRYLLSLIRYLMFYKIFLRFRKNKIYFVSEYQARLAKSAGLVGNNFIIAGNID
jgi:hypothetical protein